MNSVVEYFEENLKFSISATIFSFLIKKYMNDILSLSIFVGTKILYGTKMLFEMVAFPKSSEHIKIMKGAERAERHGKRNFSVLGLLPHH